MINIKDIKKSCLISWKNPFHVNYVRPKSSKIYTELWSVKVKSFCSFSFVGGKTIPLHNVAKRPFGISISERLYLFSRTPSGAPNGSPALTYKWTTQLLKEIAPPWPLDLSEGHGGGPGVVGDEQHWEVQQITHGTSWPSPVNHLNCWRPLVIHIYTLSTHFISKTINGIISTPFGLWFHSFDLIPVIRGTVDKYTIWSRTMAYLNHI